MPGYIWTAALELCTLQMPSSAALEVLAWLMAGTFKMPTTQIGDSLIQNWGVEKEEERGRLYCCTHSRGAALRSMHSHASLQAGRAAGASRRLCGQACLCLSPPCQDEPEARSAPHPLRSYPVFPVKEIWASGTEEQWGSQQRWQSWGVQKSTRPHTCTTRQVPPLQCPPL